jgi:hypothetical protein
MRYLPLVLLLAGCVNAALLSDVTAREVGAPADEIKIGERMKIPGGIRWKAKHGEQTYRCEATCETTGCKDIETSETFCDETTFDEVD